MLNYSDISHAASKSQRGYRVLTIQNIEGDAVAKLRADAVANYCTVLADTGGQLVVSGVVQDLVGFARALPLEEIDRMNLTESLSRAAERDGTDLLGLAIVRQRGGRGA